ncbi:MULTISPECIES: CheR family methyltransferase [unclassified Leptolyngbya]|uniref:CheR family methyltransferase n=1 Tax=unclassified Leptolyngbya TaxID=2650499 RepID=UPI0016837F0A|nr:PAS domain-containing protein [Leptolyngbya sp. FACHB-8]MBD2153348.1 PAS domain-containing protein [Leptolyngbya sp. FACHB-16]
MTETQPDADFEALLTHIKNSRGFDFTGYKRSSLIRRVNKRMQVVSIIGYNDYLDYLQVHPEEFNELFNTLLINVTSFFRDRPFWDYISEEIIPRILASKDSSEPIRVWSVGCASGEEAYTVSMVLADALGVHQFQERVKVYATDVDEEALAHARSATYSAQDIEGLSPVQVKNFFEKNDNRYTFRKDLRRSVIFGRHDLIQDAPISKIDLLVCRNTLMYFNAETQARILSRFHFALRDGGFLFLGKAEMLLSQSAMFTPVSLKYHVFTNVPRLRLGNQLLKMTQQSDDEELSPLSNMVKLRDLAFDNSPIARIVVDIQGSLVLCSEQARNLFNLAIQDIGRPLQDLEISYRPVELRSCIDQAYGDRRTVHLRDVPWQSQHEQIFLDIQVTPLFDAGNQVLGVSINFVEITRYKRLQEELEYANQELETAYEELQSTNEELETTNEELQSSNEELETTNEELQSTNEELETMNEELQSTNEEMQTVNDELQRRSEELNQSNAFLESILASLKGGVIVVDRDLRVQIWNYKAEDLWGIRTEEAIDQNFLNLDIGLPVEQLRNPIRACLSGTSIDGAGIFLPAINRRGRSIQCYITCTPLIGLQGSIQGIIMLMEEQENPPSTS